VGTAGAPALACAAPPVPLTDFPAQFAAALCDGVGPCCIAANVPYTASLCQSNALLSASNLLSESSSPNQAYNSVGAGCCLSAVKQELAACQNFDNVVEAACQGIFVGTLLAGSACMRSADCAPPGYCKIALGAPDGGTCSNDGGSNEPEGKVGDPCVGDCMASGGAIECTIAPSASGTTVTGSYCFQADGLYCASGPKVCTQFGLLGAACSFGTCSAGEYCNGAGTCAAQTDSGPCTDGGSDACSSQSYCLAGQCSAKKPDGAACLATEECSGNICDGGDGLNMGSCARETAARPSRCAGGLK
jgi:hypothetical protein